jgi:hypothetical protein
MLNEKCQSQKITNCNSTYILLCCCCFCFAFLRQGLSMQPGGPGIHDPLASASQVGLQRCSTMPGLYDIRENTKLQ